MEGSVKFFNRKKGFGFIKGDDEKDYFVHFSALPQGTYLHDNDRVTFDVTEGERGLKAENVQVTKAAEQPEGEHKSFSQQEEQQE